jgi:beta-barrel assembly-enhancing protease
VTRIFLIIILFLSLSVFQVSADSKQRQVKVQKTSLTRDQEIELGKQAAAEVEEEMDVLHSPEVEKWLNAIGQRLAQTPQANAYPYRFKLVNDASINAFSLPGGPMYVNTGLITAADNEAQVAGVLAHEMSHIALRHGASQMGRSGPMKTALGIATIAAGMVGGDLAEQAVGAGAGLGFGSILGRYSRDAERDADLNGARMMASAGYDPAELAKLFVKLNEEVGSEGRPQGLDRWLADHPDTPKRVAYIREDIRFYPDSPRKPDTGDFSQIQYVVLKIPPPKKPPVIQPPTGYRTLRLRDFGLAYPQGWLAGQAKSTGSIYIIPPDGARQQQSGGIELLLGGVIDVWKSDPVDLSKGTTDSIERLKKQDANLRADPSEHVTIGGQPALRTRIETRTSWRQDPNQVVYVYTVVRPKGLWSLALASPASKLELADPVFGRIVQSVKFAE